MNPTTAEQRDALRHVADPFRTDADADLFARFVLRSLPSGARMARVRELRQLAEQVRLSDADATDAEHRALLWQFDVAVEQAVQADRLAGWTPQRKAVTR